VLFGAADYMPPWLDCRVRNWAGDANAPTAIDTPSTMVPTPRSDAARLQHTARAQAFPEAMVCAPTLGAARVPLPLLF
jgi:hypothetical protein